MQLWQEPPGLASQRKMATQQPDRPPQAASVSGTLALYTLSMQHEPTKKVLLVVCCLRL